MVSVWISMRVRDKGHDSGQAKGKWKRKKKTFSGRVVIVRLRRTQPHLFLAHMPFALFPPLLLSFQHFSYNTYEEK